VGEGFLCPNLGIEFAPSTHARTLAVYLFGLHTTLTLWPRCGSSPAPRYLSPTTTALAQCLQSLLNPRIPPRRESIIGPTLESGTSLTSSTSYRPSSPSHTLSTLIAISCKDGKRCFRDAVHRSALVVANLSTYSYNSAGRSSPFS
jgi:hypothetical protein